MGDRVDRAAGSVLPREYAHDLVYEMCREAIRQKRTLLDLLVENEKSQNHIEAAELAKLCEPAYYLGQSGAMVDRVLRSLQRH
jgi:3-carboxy-cis,cis-muconate cycloisomerase